LVKSDAQWNEILDMASKPGIGYNSSGELGPLPDDGVDGKALIKEKLAMAKKWLKDAWNIDIDALRTEIIQRQANIE
jgi:hypothetical protein